MKALLTITTLTSGLLLSGCEKSNTHKPHASNEPQANVPAGLFQTDKPAGAKEVLAVKKTANTGDTVVVRGRIAGSKDPFVSGRAIFMLADAKLPLCSEMAMADSCETPWDLCCEPKEVLAEQTLTVEVVDSAGKPLTGTLQNVGGLAPGKTVVIKGKVQKPSAQAMIINAESISVGS